MSYCVCWLYKVVQVITEPERLYHFKNSDHLHLDHSFRE